MTPSSWRRVTAGDVFLGLATLALLAAAAFPRAERALMWRAAAMAQADVETVRAAAAGYLEEADAWPTAAEPGALPAELAGRVPPGFSFQRGRYTLEWDRWETVEDAASPVAELPPDEYESSVPPTPGDSVPAVEVAVETLGAVTVHSSDERILAALLEHFGASRSFVRERSWTLVVTPPPAAAGSEPSR